MGSAQDATRGLATVAMLKANFDVGQDHIGMFEPFVWDSLSRVPGGGASLDDLQRWIREDNQLKLPLNTLKTLLGRACRTGALVRDGGRYFRTVDTPERPILSEQRAAVLARQEQLAEGLCEAAALSGVVMGGTYEALALIMEFLDRFHVAIALDSLSEAVASREDDETAVDLRAVETARFLQAQILESGHFLPTIEETLEGFILQNALLLKDISTASRRFRDLHVFFDSGLLFRVLGHTGKADQVAALELVNLLRDTGAIVSVFEPTVREMRAILHIYEEKLATPAGQKTLYPTDMTRHFLRTRQAPSDVRIHSALIESQLSHLGFSLRRLPDHEARFTLDEAELARRLADAKGDKSPRVVHDVDCVAGVITWRRGKRAESWDDAGAVFVTTSLHTLQTVSDWYATQDDGTRPPIVHHLHLSNLAWLKRPASASKLKTHELVALCAAALRPTRAAWRRFQEHLTRLEQSGELSSDEVIAIVASHLTEGCLVDTRVGDDSDAVTLDEVVTRVKEALRAEARLEYEGAKESMLQAQLEAAAVTAAAERRGDWMGRLLSWTLVVIAAIACGAGTVLSIPSVIGGHLPSLWEGLFAAIPLAVASLLGILYGFNLLEWRRELHGPRPREWCNSSRGSLRVS